MRSTVCIVLVVITSLCRADTGRSEPAGDFNIRTYGAVGNGTDKCTQAMDRTIRACAKSGGGTVTVPAGTYVTGPIELLSNVTLHLEAGAVIKGSADIADYRGRSGRLPLIRARDARNIAIVGRGAIDGSGTSFMDMTRTRVGRDMPGDLDPNFTRQGPQHMDPKFGQADGPVVYRSRPSRLIRLTRCSNVLVRDVTLRNSPTWTLHLEDCENVDVMGIDLLNNLLVPNSDGIHCTTCQRVHISDCEISCGDDAICVTSVGSRRSGVCEDVTVTNCTLQSRSAGVRVGYGTNPVRNCTFQNVVIRDSNRGIGLFVRDAGSVENIIFSNVIIQTRLHTGHWWGNAEPIHLSVIPQTEGETTGRIKNITFSNIMAESESGIVVYGHKPGDISSVSFDDVRLHIRNSALNAAYGGNIDLRPAYDRRFAIFAHDMAALFCRHVNRLTISRFELRWDDNLPDFFSHAVSCEHFSNVVIDAFEGRQAHREDQRAAIALNGGRGAIIRNCIAAEGTGRFLALNDLRDALLLVNNNLQNASEALSPTAGRSTSVGNLMPGGSSDK